MGCLTWCAVLFLFTMGGGGTMLPSLTMTRWAVSCVMVGVSCAVFIDCDQVGCVVSRWVCNVLFLLTDQVGYAMCLVGV